MRFRDREHVHYALESARADLLARHGSATGADHHNHQRAKTSHDADQSRQIPQEPQGDMSTLHAADCTAAFSPADLAPLFPPDFRSEWLIGLKFVTEFPPSSNNDFPPNSAPICVLRNAGRMPRLLGLAIGLPAIETKESSGR
jgi:hypothetical protein